MKIKIEKISLAFEVPVYVELLMRQKDIIEVLGSDE